MIEADSNDPLRVFLCHSSADKAEVRTLYLRLKSDGFAPWLDEEDLVGGQEWEYEVKKAVRQSDVVLACLSRDSISKTGFIQKELKYALDVAAEQPEGAIFIIPLKLEPCDVPERLARWQWINYFAENGHERLIRGLQARARNASHLNKRRPRVNPTSPSTAESEVPTGAADKSLRALPEEPNWFSQNWEKAVLLAMGICFVAALLVLARAIPNPTPSQSKVFQVILSLSAAGIAASIPGAIQFKVGTVLRAGGALAVFAIVYFVNPGQFLKPEINSTPSIFSGRVWDEDTKGTVADAKVSIAEDQSVPQIIRTDADGIFHIQLLPTTQSLRITVEAKDYDPLTRDANPRRTGQEEIYIRHHRPSDSFALGTGGQKNSDSSQSPVLAIWKTLSEKARKEMLQMGPYHGAKSDFCGKPTSPSGITEYMCRDLRIFHELADRGMIGTLYEGKAGDFREYARFVEGLMLKPSRDAGILVDEQEYTIYVPPEPLSQAEETRLLGTTWGLTDSGQKTYDTAVSLTLQSR